MTKFKVNILAVDKNTGEQIYKDKKELSFDELSLIRVSETALIELIRDEIMEVNGELEIKVTLNK